MPSASAYDRFHEVSVGESERLLLLNQAYDTQTIGRLSDCLNLGGGLPIPTCLEIGGGSGALASRIVDLLGPGAQVDLLETRPQYTRASPNVEVVAGDAADFAFDRAYGLILERLTLYSAASRLSILGRCFDVLRPGGLLYLEGHYFPASFVNGPMGDVAVALVDLASSVGVDLTWPVSLLDDCDYPRRDWLVLGDSAAPTIVLGDTAEAQVWFQTLQIARPLLPGSGVRRAVDHASDLLSCPRSAVAVPPLVAVAAWA